VAGRLLALAEALVLALVSAAIVPAARVLPMSPPPPILPLLGR